MSPIIVTKCKCSKKNSLYKYSKKRNILKKNQIPKNWELEYSKRVKEEKNQYYKENIKKNGDQWIETDKNYVKCNRCGEKIEIYKKKRGTAKYLSECLRGCLTISYLRLSYCSIVDILNSTIFLFFLNTFGRNNFWVQFSPS